MFIIFGAFNSQASITTHSFIFQDSTEIVSDSTKNGFFYKILAALKPKKKRQLSADGLKSDSVSLAIDEKGFTSEGLPSNIPDLKDSLKFDSPEKFESYERLLKDSITSLIRKSKDELINKDSIQYLVEGKKEEVINQADEVILENETLLNDQKSKIPLRSSSMKDSVDSFKKKHVTYIETAKEIQSESQQLKREFESVRRAELNANAKKIESEASNFKSPFKNKYKDSFLKEFRQVKDSLDTVKIMFESKEKSLFKEYQNPVASFQNFKKEDLLKLDSLLGKSSYKEKIKNQSDSVKTLVFKKRGFLKSGNFKDLIIGIPDFRSKSFSFSPNIGFNLHKNLAGGIGLQLNAQIEKNEWVLGYKSFLRYSPLENYYLQVESTHFFNGISNLTPSEENNVENHRAALSAGIGGIYKLTSKINFNLQVLYQVIGSELSLNNSPFIFRVGIKF